MAKQRMSKEQLIEAGRVPGEIGYAPPALLPFAAGQFFVLFILPAGLVLWGIAAWIWSILGPTEMMVIDKIRSLP